MTELYAPDGRKVEANSPSTVVNLKARGYTEDPPAVITVPPAAPGEPVVTYDPAEHDVPEVKDFVAEHPAQADAVIAAEAAGRKRKTITGA